jgi:hypothetical protein
MELLPLVQQTVPDVFQAVLTGHDNLTFVSNFLWLFNFWLEFYFVVVYTDSLTRV